MDILLVGPSPPRRRLGPWAAAGGRVGAAGPRRPMHQAAKQPIRQAASTRHASGRWRVASSDPPPRGLSDAPPRTHLATVTRDRKGQTMVQAADFLAVPPVLRLAPLMPLRRRSPGSS
eukprot:335733-Rhodomonas_salina.1